MRRLSLTVAALVVSLAAGAAPRQSSWPSSDQQLKTSRVRPGSPLEKLILNNQDFGMLRAEEAGDRIPVPLWLRVHWRKGHPEGSYTASDPAGDCSDTVAAINQFEVEECIDYVSTAGGAFLEFLEGKSLPAVKALQDRRH